MDNECIEVITFSDLFFNHTHENYNGLFNSVLKGDDVFQPTLEDIEDAITDDAKEFVSCYLHLCTFYSVNAETLAKDFMSRL